MYQCCMIVKLLIVLVLETFRQHQKALFQNDSNFWNFSLFSPIVVYVSLLHCPPRMARRTAPHLLDILHTTIYCGISKKCDLMWPVERHETRLYKTNSGHFVDRTRKFGLVEWEIGIPITLNKRSMNWSHNEFRVQHNLRIKSVLYCVAPAWSCLSLRASLRSQTDWMKREASSAFRASPVILENKSEYFWNNRQFFICHSTSL